MLPEHLIETFRAGIEAKILANWADNCPKFLAICKPFVTVEASPKYVRIVRQEQHRESAVITGRSVYCFVNRETGDVLKAAGWKGPAKGERGNLNSADMFAGCGAYGPRSLK